MTKQISFLSKPCNMLVLALCLCLSNSTAIAQGTWKKIASSPSDYNYGVMLVLTDGTIMVKSASGGAGLDFYGNTWDQLIPDMYGSYINGEWNYLTPMNDTRLYFSSQVLRDGRVYVAGGEYGTGAYTGEVYNPLDNTWTYAPAPPAGDTMWDANSEMLPDGRVLQALVKSNVGYGVSCLIYDPVANTYTPAPNSNRSQDESTWLKLKDNSVLVIDDYTRYSERYIPSLNKWIVDATVPVAIYDTIIGETGPATLLPDGRAMFFGANGNTAFYTPSGSTAPGTWAAGPKIPNKYGAPDASASMMVNGKILIAVSDTPSHAVNFPSPTYFYEFDYVKDTFTQIKGPLGTDTLRGPCFDTHMTNMPDGNVLFSFGTGDYYEYIPDGTPLAAGQPSVDSVLQIDCKTYLATGKLFNGITEGSSYGDDWQMATNYPLVRLTNGPLVYYARTSNWNRPGAVMTGSLPDTTTFTLPDTLPAGTYQLQVVVNGNPSASVPFTTCPGVGVHTLARGGEGIRVYPNPATGQATLVFGATQGGRFDVKLVNVLGQVVKEEAVDGVIGKNTRTLELNGMAKGVYTVIVSGATGVYTAKLIVQ